MFESVNSAPPATGVVPSTASRQGKPLSFGAILGLHLFPGLGIFAFFLLGGPLIASWGFPPQLAFLLGSPFVGIPKASLPRMTLPWLQKPRRRN